MAGSGSELLVYDIKSGTLLKSFRVFDGIRVHGISLNSGDREVESVSIVEVLIAVYGERRLKLFRLRVEEKRSIFMELVCQLPRFDHWVLDACFLKVGTYCLNFNVCNLGCNFENNLHHG